MYDKERFATPPVDFQKKVSEALRREIGKENGTEPLGIHPDTQEEPLPELPSSGEPIRTIDDLLENHINPDQDPRFGDSTLPPIKTVLDSISQPILHVSPDPNLGPRLIEKPTPTNIIDLSKAREARQNPQTSQPDKSESTKGS